MLVIKCKEKFKKAMELSREHDDKTFANCMCRLLSFYCWKDVEKVVLYNDYYEHSFTFTVYNEDGSISINGGVIFHGFPEQGYRESGSVCIEPTYGWQIHT